MLYSIVIPTIDRPTLPRSVHSVLTQDLTGHDFEVIVVNDSGRNLPPQDWQASQRVTVIQTQERGRTVARNTGAAISKGEYLYFLDDDDWLLPDALAHFQRLIESASDAVWLHGGLRVTDDHGTSLGEFNSRLRGNCAAQVMGGAWAPLQASIMHSRSFFSVGGFDPDIAEGEDDDLCRRFAFKGPFASTDQLVACLLRGSGWQTTVDYYRVYECGLLSKDRLLSVRGSLQRLIESANSSYWLGRVLRLYLQSAKWNLGRTQLLPALSRGLNAAAVVAVSGHRLMSRSYWQALKASFAPGTLSPDFLREAYVRAYGHE